MLNAWVYALAAEKWDDFAIIVEERYLHNIECSHESGGLVSHGWGCMFSSMPHVCVFDAAEVSPQHHFPVARFRPSVPKRNKKMDTLSVVI